MSGRRIQKHNKECIKITASSFGYAAPNELISLDAVALAARVKSAPLKLDTHVLPVFTGRVYGSVNTGVKK